ASQRLAEGLVALGILTGDPAELVADGVTALLFPHGVGHLLGLDVHDMEDLGDRAGYQPGRTRAQGFGIRYLRLDRDLLAGMPLGLSIAWPEAYDPLPLTRSGHQFAQAYNRGPEFRSDRWLLESDGDPWAINVIGHGLFGAEVYGRVRQCGGGPWQALAFTAGTSVVWEYGIESFNKRPSAIDLVATPVIGAALGEAR